MKYPLVLASQSPRRRELLEVLGVPFTVVVPQIDETPKDGEPPDTYATRVARDKGLAVATLRPDSRVLASDTVVTIDGEILGKPRDQHDAVRMLEKLSGREHDVYTAVCLVEPTSKLREGLDRTRVWFNTMTRAEIVDYLGRENVMDKAGAYGIQGFASVYIPKIEGSHSNVMGLPLALVWKLLTV